MIRISLAVVAVRVLVVNYLEWTGKTKGTGKNKGTRTLIIHDKCPRPLCFPHDQTPLG